MYNFLQTITNVVYYRVFYRDSVHIHTSLSHKTTEQLQQKTARENTFEMNTAMSAVNVCILYMCSVVQCCLFIKRTIDSLHRTYMVSAESIFYNRRLSYNETKHNNTNNSILFKGESFCCCRWLKILDIPRKCDIERQYTEIPLQNTLTSHLKNAPNFKQDINRIDLFCSVGYIRDA